MFVAQLTKNVWLGQRFGEGGSVEMQLGWSYRVLQYFVQLREILWDCDTTTTTAVGSIQQATRDLGR